MGDFKMIVWVCIAYNVDGEDQVCYVASSEDKAQEWKDKLELACLEWKKAWDADDVIETSKIEKTQLEPLGTDSKRMWGRYEKFDVQ